MGSIMSDRLTQRGAHGDSWLSGHPSHWGNGPEWGSAARTLATGPGSRVTPGGGWEGPGGYHRDGPAPWAAPDGRTEGARGEGPARKIPALKPPAFDGTGTVEAFLAQFRVAAYGNRWTDEEMGWQLATCLKGATSEILAQVDLGGPGVFARIADALGSRYISNPRTCQQQLACRKQLAGETLQKLGDEILLLARRAHPGLSRVVVESIASSYFIAALKSDDIRRFVVLTRPANYQEFVAAAIEAQPLQATYHEAKARPLMAMDKPWSRDAGTTGRATGRGEAGRGKDRFGREIECWLCRGPHLRRQCPEYIKLRERLNPAKEEVAKKGEN